MTVIPGVVTAGLAVHARRAVDGVGSQVLPEVPEKNTLIGLREGFSDGTRERPPMTPVPLRADQHLFSTGNIVQEGAGASIQK